ncbi:ABC transporter substrate-binding protein [Calderihabitans maritimus]|uniref:NLPA lipoprotein n=1 Tax=Calderihabitans maritimus TaxID=1246530 RepID=A0A1Z5HVW9_9FIRM|nr:ABC transporter substrate-binding protein [Calderihabitans maritimus]GAW93686.1 NLPA lipoprotein [Calderihabitans maritimus]
MKSRKLALTVLIMIIVLITAACSGSQEEGTTKSAEGKPIIKVGYLPITHSLPLVVAHKLDGNQYKNFELELVKFSSWPELTEALNSGQIQAGITMFELAMVSKQRGIPNEIVLLSHRNGDVLVVNKEINDIRELKGKLVAIPHRLSGHNILLYKALRENGIDYDEVEKVEMAPPDMPAALARGEIAGYIVAEPFGAQSVVSGTGKVLLRAQDIWPNWICCGLVINPRYMPEDPEILQELVDSLVRAGKFIEQQQGEAINIALEYMQIKAELWEQSLEWISYDDLLPTRGEFVDLQKYLLELPWNGKPRTLLSREVNLEELVNPQYAVQAYEKVK